jgi:hypothetical protein
MFLLAGTKRAQMENVSAKRSVATHFYTENILTIQIVFKSAMCTVQFDADRKAIKIAKILDTLPYY